MTLSRIFLILSLSLSMFHLNALAEEDDGVAAAGLFPPLQYPGTDATVWGLRLSPGWARHKEMYGIDMGLIGNMTDENFVGVSMAGGFNYTAGNAFVIFTQLAGGVNHSEGSLTVLGIQLAIGANNTRGEAHIIGAQLSTIGNFGHNNIYGVQFGIINQADEVYGFQVGLINRAKNLHGIQIGLANYNEAGPLKFMPVINVGF